MFLTVVFVVGFLFFFGPPGFCHAGEAGRAAHRAEGGILRDPGLCLRKSAGHQRLIVSLHVSFNNSESQSALITMSPLRPFLNSTKLFFIVFGLFSHSHSWFRHLFSSQLEY